MSVLKMHFMLISQREANHLLLLFGAAQITLAIGFYNGIQLKYFNTLILINCFKIVLCNFQDCCQCSIELFVNVRVRICTTKFFRCFPQTDNSCRCSIAPSTRGCCRMCSTYPELV